MGDEFPNRADPYDLPFRGSQPLILRKPLETGRVPHARYFT
jgi:hypothetical protein